MEYLNGLIRMIEETGICTQYCRRCGCTTNLQAGVYEDFCLCGSRLEKSIVPMPLEPRPQYGPSIKAIVYALEAMDSGCEDHVPLVVVAMAFNMPIVIAKEIALGYEDLAGIADGSKFRFGNETDDEVMVRKDYLPEFYSVTAEYFRHSFITHRIL